MYIFLQLILFFLTTPDSVLPATEEATPASVLPATEEATPASVLPATEEATPVSVLPATEDATALTLPPSPPPPHQETRTLREQTSLWSESCGRLQNEVP